MPSQQISLDRGPAAGLINLVVHKKSTAVADNYVLSDNSISWSKKAYDSSLQILFCLEKQLLKKVMEAEGIL